MAGVLTGIDKALLLRAARLLVDKAAGIEAAVACLWSGRRAEKREFDALHRDARDLRALVKRLQGFDRGPAEKIGSWALSLHKSIVIGDRDAAVLALHELAKLVPEIVITEGASSG